jgi:uncharacterized protein YwgA
VAGPEEHLTPREAVLLVLAAAGGTIAGRTVVQKMTYFAGITLGEDLGHAAHYYGPYSREIERALTHCALAEDVRELIERFPAPDGHGRERRRHTYTLTDQGRTVVEELRVRFRGQSATIDDVVARLDRAVPSRDQHSLSLAAKTDLIVRQRNEPTPATEIPVLARELDWEFSDGDVEQALSVLRSVAPAAAAPTV